MAAKKVKAYRLPGDVVAEAQRIAKESKGTLKESDVVRIAIRHGLRHVAESVLPLVTGKTQKP